MPRIDRLSRPSATAARRRRGRWARVSVMAGLWVWLGASGWDAAWAAIPKTFPPPAETAWAPAGCRAVSPSDAVLGPRVGWRNLHGDAASSDEVETVHAPMFVEDWVAESNTFNVTGPVFDAQGDLYFAPLRPYEDVILISVDGQTGARRFAIADAGTGAPTGTSAPLVLEDPSNPGDQIVYHAVYDRVVALQTDGTIVWDEPSGLSLPIDPDTAQVFGLVYVPQVDGILGLTVDGLLFGLDRATGSPILTAPHSLPGSPSPEGEVGGGLLTPEQIETVRAELAQLIDLPEGDDDGLGTLLGNGVEVANHFSVDAHTGAIWIAATAPDGDDGTVDGVSELGALYRIDLSANGAGYDVVETCSASFVGGSASTPALSADGTRVYVADNQGRLIAIDAGCNEVWSLSLGAQIVGSIAVASDNGELYAATAAQIFQVIDTGASGVAGWTADIDVYTLGGIEQQTNLNLVSIGENGLYFQAGAGVIAVAPSVAGVGLLDRADGSVRSYVAGFDETVAVMSTAPDGTLYIGNSPLRRAIARAVVPAATPPLVGGVTRYAPARLDLLVRDAACAGEVRAANAAAVAGTCPASSAADANQVQILIDQARDAGPIAVGDGDFSAPQWASVAGWLDAAESSLGEGDLIGAGDALGNACGVAAGASAVPSVGDAARVVLVLMLALLGVVSIVVLRLRATASRT